MLARITAQLHRQCEADAARNAVRPTDELRRDVRRFHIAAIVLALAAVVDALVGGGTMLVTFIALSGTFSALAEGPRRELQQRGAQQPA